MPSLKFTPEQNHLILEIAEQMRSRGIKDYFVSASVGHAVVNERTRDLMIMWLYAETEEEKKDVIEALQEEIGFQA